MTGSSHEPVRHEKLVAASRAGLLLFGEKRNSVEHEGPCARALVDHVHGRRPRIDAGAGGRVLGGHGRRLPHVHAGHVLMVRRFLLRPADQTQSEKQEDDLHRHE